MTHSLVLSFHMIATNQGARRLACASSETCEATSSFYYHWGLKESHFHTYELVHDWLVSLQSTEDSAMLRFLGLVATEGYGITRIWTFIWSCGELLDH